MTKLILEFEVSDQLVSDILETGMEYMDYWGDVLVIDRTQDSDRIFAITVREESEDESIVVDIPKVIEGLKKLFSPGFSVGAPYLDNMRRAIADDDGGYVDAEDCDIIIQVAAFGEIRYG